MSYSFSLEYLLSGQYDRMPSCLYSARSGNAFARRYASSTKLVNSIVVSLEQVFNLWSLLTFLLKFGYRKLSLSHRPSASNGPTIPRRNITGKAGENKGGFSPDALRRLGDSLQDSPDSARWSTSLNVPNRRDNITLIRPGKRKRLSPPQALSRWLDMNKSPERESYWQMIKKSFSASSLPIILLHYIHRSAAPGVRNRFWIEGKLELVPSQAIVDEIYFRDEATASLRRRGLTVGDLEKWAWILTAENPDQMAERFLETPSDKPTFLLLEILRRDILHVRTLKLILIYTWDQIMRKTRPNLLTTSDMDIDELIPWSDVTQFSLGSEESTFQAPQLEETEFAILISRLLYHARRIWHPAVVSISHMVAPYVSSILDSNGADPQCLDRRTHARMSKLHNQLLRLLALPASIEPLKSMVHNWQAQRVILETAVQFEPSLTLDQNSYRAIIQVLAASKKSEKESKVSKLRNRSWPPWRVDQDGMDAQRSPEEDSSRVLMATMRTKESGYVEDGQDIAMTILGGREPDGTPTIQTRKLIKRRVRPASKDGVSTEFDADHWAARIQATRDIQEAWSAFTGFEERGCQPSLSMYFAMFEKLNYESARSGREQRQHASPGDGKEVIPSSTENFSRYYKWSIQPPTLSDLYTKMMVQGLRPSGRCLTFLVQHARTVDEGLLYLRDSGLDHRALSFLSGATKSIPPTILDKIPIQAYAAFIVLVCRFAPRAIASGDVNKITSGEFEARETGEPADNAELVVKRWDIREMTTSSGRSRLNPLRHAVGLLKQRHTNFRPAWYAVFNALARRGVIIDRNMVGHPENDILSWRVLEAALTDFHKSGLELDPRGFQIICNGFEKAILASFDVSEVEGMAVVGAFPLLKAEFRKIFESEETRYGLPKLLHTVHGAHLHAYVRVLGFLEEYDEMLSVLEWMVQNQDALAQIAEQSRNGSKLIRRTIIAFKVFCTRTASAVEAERLVESVGKWGGWPGDSEAQKYIGQWSGKPESDELGES